MKKANNICVRVVATIAFALLLVAAACPLYGATYTVHSKYNEETGVWEGDFDELTNTIATVSTWQTIKLERGVYDIAPLTNAPMGKSTYQGPSLIHLPAGTTLVGATGNRDDVIIKGPGKYRLLQHANGCTIKHITFTGGHAEGGSYIIGGAIYPTGSAIEITNCAFLFNSSEQYGGAVGGNHNSFSGDNFTDCYFYGNSTGGAGYGGAGVGGKFINCTIVSNYCGYAYGLGGGLYGATLVSGCTVVSNVSAHRGGGLSHCKNVSDCFIAFNAAWDKNTPRGGGLSNCGTITNCTVAYNLAYGWGHGMVDTSAYGCRFIFNGVTRDSLDFTLEKCDFAGSTMSEVSLVDSCRIHHVSNVIDILDNVVFGPCRRTITYPISAVRHIRNSLIDHLWITNTSNHAAFYANGYHSLRLENCTIADNTLTYTVRDYSSPSSTVSFVNCALARNYAANGSTKRDLSGIYSSYNCLTNCILGVRSIAKSADMQDCNTEDMGENWSPRFADEGEFPYEPRYGSKLRGAGMLLDWMDGDSLDLSGRARLRDGKVDAGAYQCWMDPVGAVFIFR